MAVLGRSRTTDGANGANGAQGVAGADPRPTGAGAAARPLAALRDNILLRAVLYYVALLGGAALVWGYLPPGVRVGAIDTFAPLLRPEGAATFAQPTGKHAAAEALAAGNALAITREPVSLAVVASALGAFLLALPVAWIYMTTRAKKGYRQSVVHTLVLLPAVVAGVVVLVKNSLALAFALAGIVAAVRFRNTLDDSRDAVYLFFVTALGLAAGVELDVAVAMSLTFNVIVLVLWYTDFARTPPALEGARAQRQMERALAIANRTSQFVARVDREILDALAPEQIEALARRVERRRMAEGGGKPFDARLHLVTRDTAALRPLVEPVLEARVKRWRFRGTRQGGDGIVVADYDVRWGKDAVPGSVTDALRAAAAGCLLRADVEPLVDPLAESAPPTRPADDDDDD